MENILSKIEAARMQLVDVKASIDAINEDPLAAVLKQTHALKEDFRLINLSLDVKLGKVLEALTPLALFLGIRNFEPPKIEVRVRIADPTVGKGYYIGSPGWGHQYDTGLQAVHQLGIDNAIALCRVLSQEIGDEIPRVMQAKRDQTKSRSGDVEYLMQDAHRLAELIKSALKK
jgi:hypothetical protein